MPNFMESFPDEEGYKALQTGRIKTRATVGTPDYVHKPEHIRNVMQGYTLGSLLPSGDRRDVFDIDYSPEALKLDQPRGSTISDIDQRLQKLEGRTISDIDLDNMTKPAPKGGAAQKAIGRTVGEDGFNELKATGFSDFDDDINGLRAGPQGIGAMQEPDMSSMIPPEVSAALGNGIKNAVKQDPTVDQATKEQIYSLSDNNIGELVGQMLEKGMEIPDEEVSSMSMEKEEEAEGIIDRLMGNEQGMGMLDIEITPNSATYREEGFDLPTVEVYGEEMGWRERLNQLGDPEDINFAPTGLNWGGPVKQYNLGGIASMGRGGDSQLAHVMPGERMVPPGVVDDGMLDAAFVRAGLDPMEYKVGSSQAAVNPMTGMPEYGLFSFVKRLLKKVKKIAPVIGQIVGFAYGGPMGAGIGKAIGGVLKTGDLDFKDALMNFGTGWAMGNFATGMGMKGGVAKGQGIAGMKTIFQGAGKGGIWGWGAQTPMGQHTIESGDTVAGIAEKYGITEQDLRSANPGAITPSIAGAAPSIAGAADPYGYGAAAAKLLGTDVQALAGPGGLPGVGTILNVPKVEGVGDFIQSAGARLAGGMGAPGTLPSTGLVEQFKNLPMGQKLGVGALGLAALSKTGMFDEEELGDVPPEIQTEMEGLRAYANQPLTAAVQGQWGVGSPTVSTPAIPSHTSFYTPPSQSSSLTEALAELNKTNLRLPSPVFT